MERGLQGITGIVSVDWKVQSAWRAISEQLQGDETNDASSEQRHENQEEVGRESSRVIQSHPKLKDFPD